MKHVGDLCSGFALRNRGLGDNLMGCCFLDVFFSSRLKGEGTQWLIQSLKERLSIVDSTNILCFFCFRHSFSKSIGTSQFGTNTQGLQLYISADLLSKNYSEELNLPGHICTKTTFQRIFTKKIGVPILI